MPGSIGSDRFNPSHDLWDNGAWGLGLVNTSEDRSNRRSSNSAPPARLPTKFTLKVKTQMGRVVLLVDALNSLQEYHSDMSEEELNAQVAHVEETYEAFIKEHSYLEETCPSAFTDHDYFDSAVYVEGCRAYSSFKRFAARLRSALTPLPRQSRAPQSASDTQLTSRLQGIALPKASDDKSQWPTFHEMATCLILESNRLTDEQRLHYLRGCLESAPTQLSRNTRARALERIESAPIHIRRSPTTRRTSSQLRTPARPTSSSSSASASYPCDCCNGSHFIVMCTRFRELNHAERRKIAVDRRLCFNCLGRHNARSCKSTHGCKTCSGHHHTMLHEA